MDKQKMQSFDVIGSNIKKIQQLFPNCVTERKGKDGKAELAIDFEKLQAELSDDIIGEGEERYQFTWPNKRAANHLANTPTTMTLRPCREDSVDFDNTQNIYIEGDNLDVLKALRETYLGKVKMIYIDPPYNTGNDFVYNDKYNVGKKMEEDRNGLFDEEGNQTLSQYERNTASNGRFHTDWLNMIYPRLKVARDLLSDNGVIVISIDDCEIENLKKCCNEIFGEQNIISCFVWNCSTAGGIRPKFASKTHEYLLMYAKNKEQIGMLYAPLSQSAIAMYKQKDDKGYYRDKDFVFKNKSTNINQKYEIECPDGEVVYPKQGYIYRFTHSKFEEALQESLVTFKKTKTGPLITKDGKQANWNIYIKKYLGEAMGAPSTLIPKEMASIYNVGTQCVQNLFDGDRVFDNVKPVDVISYFIKMISTSETILDFFSGSATTAHAVMQLNAEDGGNRKFIMVQLPELTDEKSEAYKAGYKNICEIGEERIRRAGKKIIEDLKSEIDTKERLLDRILNAEPSATVKILLIEEQKKIAKKIYEEKAVPLMKEIDKIKERIEKLDTGFRVFKLDTSNMEDVYYTPQEFDEQKLFTDNVKAGRTNEDLLFQVMLDLGIELSAKIEVKEIAGKTVHIVDDNYFVACFDEDVNETTIKEIAKLKPVYFVMRDASAANDNVIDNFEQIFRHYSPETTCRIL